MQRYQNSVTFQIFPNFGRGGGAVHRKSIFPKFKKVQIIPVGGQENYGLFPQFGTFLVLIAPLTKYVCSMAERVTEVKSVSYSEEVQSDNGRNA